MGKSTTCVVCGTDLAPDDPACERCGLPRRRRRIWLWGVASVVATLAGMAAIGSTTRPGHDGLGRPEPAPTPRQQEPADPGVKRDFECPVPAHRFLEKMRDCGFTTEGLTEEALCRSIDTTSLRYAATLDCWALSKMLHDAMNH